MLVRVSARVCILYDYFHDADGVVGRWETYVCTYIVTIIDLFYSSFAHKARRAVVARDR